MGSGIDRLEMPTHPGALAPSPNPPGIRRSARQAGWSLPLPEDRLPRPPAKESASGRVRGVFHRGERPQEADPARQAEQGSDHPGGNPYPQIVPNLWRRIRAFFIPPRVRL